MSFGRLSDNYVSSICFSVNSVQLPVWSANSIKVFSADSYFRRGWELCAVVKCGSA